MENKLLAQHKALLDIDEVDMDNEEDYQKLCTTEDGEGNEMRITLVKIWQKMMHCKETSTNL